jgi:regulator of sigma E protease
MTLDSIVNVLTAILAFVAALGPLIVVHEFGHYAVARACGVKVLRFSVGFGKALWSRRFGRDATEWTIAAFPLGGYVKMLDEREGVVAASELPRAFNRQPVWKRFAIVAAGPVANFLLAIALYWVLFLHGVPGVKPVIDEPPAGTAARAAGFTVGDTLTRIDGESIATWQDARWVLLQRAVQRSAVTVEALDSEGRTVSREFDLSGLTAADLDSDFLKTLGLTRFPLQAPPEIQSVNPAGAAARAGLKKGDEIVGIDNVPMKSIKDAIRVIEGHPGKRLIFEVRRDATQVTVAVVPDLSTTQDGRKVGRINAMLQNRPEIFAKYLVVVRYGPFDSLSKALHKTWETSVFSLKMLGKMMVGQVSLKNLSGPITIADYAGQSAQGGVPPFLMFLALISISLGVLNLLPIPLLDGGHLMYYTVEIFKGRPISDRAIEIGQHVGMALLFSLMAFALYNDINRLISG